MPTETSALLQSNANGRHQSPGDFLPPITKENIRPASRAKIARGNILHRNAGTFKNGAIRSPQIQLHARRFRLMPRRHHRKPRQRIRIFSGSKRVVRPIEPFPRIIKLAREFLSHIRPNFIAAAPNAGSERREYFLRPRTKQHAHAPNSFFSNALQRPTPTSMDSRDHAMLGIRKKNRNAIRSLHGDEKPGRGGDERIALERSRRRSVDHMNNIGMDLAQGDERHTFCAECFLEPTAILFHSSALVPFGEAKIQDKFSLLRSGLIVFEAARPSKPRAETMYQPFLPRQISRLQYDQVLAMPLGPRPGAVAPGRGFRTRLFPRALLTANQSFRHCPNSAPAIGPGR